MSDVKPRVRAFLACSLDGFIAGEGDDLSWLPGPESMGDSDGGFGAFLSLVGALLMGRRTFDVLAAMPGAPWPYGDRPVLVATHRPLSSPQPQVRPVSGDAATLVAAGLAAAGGRDLYVDGGALVRSVLQAGMLDELVITQIPVALGRGLPLLAGIERLICFRTTKVEPLPAGIVQWTLVPERPAD